jgi:hypothetical protein
MNKRALFRPRPHIAKAAAQRFVDQILEVRTRVLHNRLSRAVTSSSIVSVILIARNMNP